MRIIEAMHLDSMWVRSFWKFGLLAVEFNILNPGRLAGGLKGPELQR